MFKDDKFKILIFFTLPFVIFITFFLLSFIDVHAESYFPMSQNQNGNFTQTDINKINSYFDLDNKFVFISFDGKSNQWGGYYIKYFWVAQVTKGNFNGDPIPLDQPTLFGEINSNGYLFSLYELSDYGVSVVRYYYDNYADFIGTSTTGNMNNFTNLTSSAYNSSKDYISNFSLYTDNTYNRSVVLSYGDDADFLPTVQGGHAVEPNPFQDPILANGSNYTLPREVPEAPTYNSYTWITYAPPSVDTSTIETLLGSLIDVVKYNTTWLKTGIEGTINNAVYNLKLSLEYIGATIQYYGGLIIDNIQDAIQNLYDNFVALLQPITQFFLYIISLGLDDEGNFSLFVLSRNVFQVLFIPDSEDLSDLLVSHDLYGVISLAETTQTNINTIKSMITSGDPLYKLTIDRFQILGIWCGPYDIDFSWYLNYKNIGDPIISAFLIFGFFLWLHARLPYWFRAQQGDIIGFTKEVQK